MTTFNNFKDNDLLRSVKDDNLNHRVIIVLECAVTKFF